MEQLWTARNGGFWIRIYIVADGYREINGFYIICGTLYLRISANNVELLQFDGVRTLVFLLAKVASWVWKLLAKFQNY